MLQRLKYRYFGFYFKPLWHTQHGIDPSCPEDRVEWGRIEDFGELRVYHHEAPHGEREDPDGFFTKTESKIQFLFGGFFCFFGIFWSFLQFRRRFPWFSDGSSTRFFFFLIYLFLWPDFGYPTHHYYLDVIGVFGNDFVVIGSGVSSRILTEFRTFGSGFLVVVIFE